MVALLKYIAIFISAASGAVGLLYDFKTKDGKVTRIGWFSLGGIILSFVVAAILQGIEISDNKEAAIAEQHKTQNLLDQIARGVYNISDNNISFDFSASLSYHRKIFEKYNARLRKAYDLLKDWHAALPAGTSRFPGFDANGKKYLAALEIEPGSPLFPDKNTEPEVYALIGGMALDVSVYKYDNLKAFDSFPASQNYNLSFRTEWTKPVLLYWFSDSIIEVTIDGLKTDADEFAWRNHGGIEALPDLQNGIILFNIESNQDLNNDALDIQKSIHLSTFSFNVRGRKFTTGKPCSLAVNGYPFYYLKLPADMLGTHHNIECDGNNTH